MTRRIQAAGLMATLFAVLFATAALAAGASDVFTVAAVPVDATAANANAARDVARLEGERAAYTILLDRLTLASDHARLPRATDATLNELIQGFEVANERSSAVRYLANYTFHFRPDAVRSLLRQANIPFAETPSKPLVVLAVFQGPSGPMLWDDPNPWRDAWGANTLPQGLVPLIMPLGELADVSAIDAATAASGDDAHLQAISARYNGADVLVSRAALKTDQPNHELDVNTTRYNPGAPAGSEQTWVATYTATPGESDADLMASAVIGTVGQVEEAWKQANIVNFNQAGTLVATVPLTDLAGWVAVRERLSGIATIQRTDLLSLDRHNARVAIHYIGDQSQLRLALAQRNLDLSGTDPNWVLERRTAAPQH